MTNEKLTNRQAIGVLDGLWANPLFGDSHRQAFEIGIKAIKALEQEPCEDAISRQAVLELVADYDLSMGQVVKGVHELPSVTPQPKTGQYEKHIDHTECIWYGSDSGCPFTCSQYRDGWNDAMDYIFKNGKGYQPYRHDISWDEVDPQKSEG